MQIRRRSVWTLLCAFLLLLGTSAEAQAGSPELAPVVMLSDLHLDPFYDPGKVAQLVAMPIEQWDTILLRPGTPGRAEAHAALLNTCGSRGEDSSYALMISGLEAARRQAANARFVTVTGDLLVHRFACLAKAALPGSSVADGAAFAAKTGAYVMRRIEGEFSGLPVYFALGNNDVSCGDNRMDVNDAFLTPTAPWVVAGLAGASATERRQALQDYKVAGFYTVMLPAPMRRTRLIVIDDTYLLAEHRNCAVEKDGRGGALQLAWLAKQLNAAKKRGEQVWVMGHIAPGIDSFGTFARMKSVCAESVAKPFLETDELARELTHRPGLVKLALFAHSHNDEVRLLQAAPGEPPSPVPLKMVASISPINGNGPSFTLASVDPRTAALVDYTIYVASNSTGMETVWSREYSFREAYQEPDFSAPSLAEMIGRMRKDPAGESAQSEAYEKFFMINAKISPIETLWPQYVCMLDHDSVGGYKDCACGAGK